LLKAVWMRISAVLLIAALLPLAPLGGIGGAGVARAQDSSGVSEQGYMSWFYESIRNNEVIFEWSVTYSGAYQL